MKTCIFPNSESEEEEEKPLQIDLFLPLKRKRAVRGRLRKLVSGIPFLTLKKEGGEKVSP